MRILVRTVALVCVVLLMLVALSAHQAIIADRGSVITAVPVAAHFLAFPVAVCLGLILLWLVAFAGVLLHKKKSGDISKFWSIFCVGLFATAVLHGSLVFYGSGGDASLSPGQSQIVVLEWNTHDSADSAQFAAMINQFDPDVFVLPELGDYDTQDGTRLGDMLRQSGNDPENYSVFSSPSEGEIAPVTVIVKNSLGDYTDEDADLATFGSIILTPRDTASDLPVIVAVHTAPPLPGLMQNWRNDLEQIQQYASRHSGGRVIIAGDFNAQIYHGSLSALSDFSDSKPSILGGTWPKSAPSALRSHIDHVLVSETCAVNASEYYETQTSDHVALVSFISC